MSVLCKTLKNVQGKGTEITWFSLHTLPSIEVRIKIQQRHHMRDNSLLNFSFLAGSLLVCIPRPTQKSLGGRTITEY